MAKGRELEFDVPIGFGASCAIRCPASVTMTFLELIGRRNAISCLKGASLTETTGQQPVMSGGQAEISLFVVFAGEDEVERDAGVDF